MLSAIPFQFMTWRVCAIASLLLGGCLAFIPYSAQAKDQHRVLIAQVYDFGSPPPPPVVTPSVPVPSNQDRIPRGNINYYQNGRYLVYVDGNNSQLLERVRGIEPGAFVRQFQGRSVIQAGVFRRRANAQQRLSQLQNYGFGDVRFANLNNRSDVPYLPDENDSQRRYGYDDEQRNYQYYDQPSRSQHYYVVIPAKAQDLPMIEDRVRHSDIGPYTKVIATNHPRGAHVVVGLFTQRSDAEDLNKYLRSIGFGNARVYYGR